MDFQLNDEQKQLRREIRDFAEREIRDNVMKWDEESKFPLDVVKQLGKMGVMGIIMGSLVIRKLVAIEV